MKSVKRIVIICVAAAIVLTAAGVVFVCGDGETAEKTSAPAQSSSDTSSAQASSDAKSSDASASVKASSAKTSNAYVVSSSDSKYTYSDLKTDIKTLTAKYPDRLSAEVLGKTADNRNLYVLYLGNKNAKRQIFVTADVHAREYINGQVAMKCVEYYCRNYKTGTYKGVKYLSLFNDVCIVVMPMVNPDGVAIAALGPSSIKSAALESKIRKMNRNGGYDNWQANARGVDLNRNYGTYKYGADHPQSEYYGGTEPFSENETKAVISAMKSCSNVKAFLNLHSMGNVMYWGYYSTSYKTKCWSLVSSLKALNGYSTINESASSNNHGDLEHYIINTYKAPYACIESGTSIPVPNYEFDGIFAKQKYEFAMCAYKYSN